MSLTKYTEKKLKNIKMRSRKKNETLNFLIPKKILPGYKESWCFEMSGDGIIIEDINGRIFRFYSDRDEKLLKGMTMEDVYYIASGKRDEREEK